MRTALIVITGAYGAGGGIAAVNRLSIRALLENNYFLKVIALNEIAPIYVDIGHYANNYHQTACQGKKISFVWKVWRALLHHRNELILVDHINLASILAPFAIFGLCKYSVWLFGIECFPLPDWQGKLGLMNASRRIAISSFTKNKVKSSFPSLDIRVCDLALNLDEIPSFY